MSVALERRIKHLNDLWKVVVVVAALDMHSWALPSLNLQSDDNVVRYGESRRQGTPGPIVALGHEGGRGLNAAQRTALEIQPCAGINPS